MNFGMFDNSPFPVFVSRGMKIVYRNQQARRSVPSLRAGERISRVLSKEALDADVGSGTAVPVGLKSGNTGTRFFAFSRDDELYFIGAASPLCESSERVVKRICEGLPGMVKALKEDDVPPPSPLRSVLIPLLKINPDEGRRRPAFYDFGSENTFDLSELLSALCERITERFHVLGLKLSYTASGTVFRSRISPDEYTYFIFVMSYLTAAFPNARLSLTGGDFISVDFSCDAGDGSHRDVGADEFFSILGVSGFTAGMLRLMSPYFDSLCCTAEGFRLSARLVHPASLAFLFSGGAKATEAMLSLLGEYLVMI